MMPTAPAASSLGNNSRTVCSLITVSTATHSSPLSAAEGYSGETVGAVIDGSSVDHLDSGWCARSSS